MTHGRVTGFKKLTVATPWPWNRIGFEFKLGAIVTSKFAGDHTRLGLVLSLAKKRIGPGRSSRGSCCRKRSPN